MPNRFKEFEFEFESDVNKSSMLFPLLLLVDAVTSPVLARAELET